MSRPETGIFPIKFLQLLFMYRRIILVLTGIRYISLSGEYFDFLEKRNMQNLILSRFLILILT